MADAFDRSVAAICAKDWGTAVKMISAKESLFDCRLPDSDTFSGQRQIQDSSLLAISELADEEPASLV